VVLHVWNAAMSNDTQDLNVKVERTRRNIINSGVSNAPLAWSREQVDAAG
jgi:hypothetical protein